jgi:mannose-1-phosphate guanylyltransferase
MMYAVIMAGGSGTRLWPRSRKDMPKQFHSLTSEQSLLQETVSRLEPMINIDQIYIIANKTHRKNIKEQLGRLPEGNVIAEPLARNTAPAVGIMAEVLHAKDPNATMLILPSDHFIKNGDAFRRILKVAEDVIEKDDVLLTLGIKPTYPETGYGYIEAGANDANGSLRVRRFTEKPDAARAAQFLAAGNYLWNSGMFLWSARTIVNALREHLPQTAPLLEQIAASLGTRQFASTFRRLYPKCENISVDYAFLEPRSAKGEGPSRIFCLPSDFGWNDLGSWTALHEHHVARSKPADGNIVSASKNFTLDANNNYIHAPGKYVAAVGVKNLVVVDTGDALLITTLEQAQNVGKVVKHLDEKKLKGLV